MDCTFALIRNSQGSVMPVLMWSRFFSNQRLSLYMSVSMALLLSGCGAIAYVE